jgi:hypothetical protein
VTQIAAQGRGHFVTPLGWRDESDDESDSQAVIQYNFAPAMRFVPGGCPTIIREAWVWKRSAWMKKWDRRYLVLRGDGLFSFHSPREEVPSVIFESVRGCASDKESGGMAIFTVKSKRGSCMLASEDPKERDQWVESIGEVLLRHY